MPNSGSPQKLLIIDDETNLLYSMAKALKRDSIEVITADTAAAGLGKVRLEKPDAVVLDVRLPDAYGLDVFDEIRKMIPNMPVIIITAFSTMETAVEAMKRGAYEYLLKPIELAVLKDLVNRALEISRSDRSSRSLHPNYEPRPDQQIVGSSPAMQEVFKAIGRVAPQDITVLIQGESGSGKELVAEAIREHSLRAKGPFLAMNCAAIQETILESELFGHEKGAFTGADRARIGKFEQVDGGTLFLDEIGDMSSATQAKVLRLLQDGSFQPVGSNETRRANVRVIAATNRNLEKMVAEGVFREDLYYRLRGFVIEIPPLRNRLDDLESLVMHFIKQFNQELGKSIESITEEAMRCMKMYHWPGNVRELQSTMRYALLYAVGDTITSGSLPPHIRGDVRSNDQASVIDGEQLSIAALISSQLSRNSQNLYRNIHSSVDRILLNKVMDFADGSQVQAAQVLGISRTTLRARLNELELPGDRSPCSVSDGADQNLDD
ncbi:sigma-54-dependent transcriptional regulator [Planctomicrobium sp. SH668]|uniref:sigma-54-dependent transcriptional regulator n=1 Tax=Planctomicrobium sp. SH668 TaxID=3448126 RepID=UPI003F5BA626